MTSKLDRYDLASLSLYRATPEQDLQTRKYTYEEWGKRSGLSFEEYLKMDDSLRQEPHAKDKLTTW